MSAAASRRLSGDGAARARRLFRGHPRRLRSAAGQLFVRIVVRAGPRAVRRICELVVRVEKRRGDELYINDGAYGALFDAAHIGWRYPVRLLRDSPSRVRPADFSFYGPTCDDLDRMAGPFALPADVGPGDTRDRHAWGLRLRHAHRLQRLQRGGHRDRRDEPMASLYGAARPDKRSRAVTR